MASLTTTKKKIKLDKYYGMWVAFIKDKIVAHDKTLNGLIKKLDGMKIRNKASVFRVPRKEEGPYILFVL